MGILDYTVHRAISTGTCEVRVMAKLLVEVLSVVVTSEIPTGIINE